MLNQIHQVRSHRSSSGHCTSFLPAARHAGLSEELLVQAVLGFFLADAALHDRFHLAFSSPS
jgi:hypothetical protein